MPDAWHAVGSAGVLLLEGVREPTLQGVPLLVLALATGLLVDLVSATLRESAALRIAPHVQLRVFLLVWAVDAGLAPVGFLAALAARDELAAVGLIVPVAALLLILARDRTAHLESA